MPQKRYNKHKYQKNYKYLLTPEQIARKREFWQEHVKAQEAEASGEFEHLIHTDEITTWIGQGRPVSELTALFDQRREVNRILHGTTPEEDELDAAFNRAISS